VSTYPDCEQRIDRNLAQRLDDMRDIASLMRCDDVDDLPEVGTLGQEILETLDDDYTADDVRGVGMVDGIPARHRCSRH
jgi:hypothetical protein